MIFKDFASAAASRRLYSKCQSEGVVERDLTKEGVVLRLQSYWAEKPMATSTGNTWPVRWAKAGEERSVRVYSICERAELFLNGKSMGTCSVTVRIFQAAGLRGTSPLRMGLPSARCRA